jgi:hypothetical protein
VAFKVPGSSDRGSMSQPGRSISGPRSPLTASVGADSSSMSRTSSHSTVLKPANSSSQKVLSCILLVGFSAYSFYFCPFCLYIILVEVVLFESFAEGLQSYLDAQAISRKPTRKVDYGVEGQFSLEETTWIEAEMRHAVIRFHSVLFCIFV